MGALYRDVGSASRYAAKAREGFDRLIADLQAGRFGADLLLLWEGSRGSRRTNEWVQLIGLCEDHAVKIFIYTYERLLDPANPYDRADLLEMAIKSEWASAETSKPDLPWRRPTSCVSLLISAGSRCNPSGGWWNGLLPG